MHVQVNTDSRTPGSADLDQSVRTIVESKLGRFAEFITRVEVHLMDENSPARSTGNDKRALIEVRPRGLDPISASDHAASYDTALRSAADKMRTQLDTITGKLGRR